MVEKAKRSAKMQILMDSLLFVGLFGQKSRKSGNSSRSDRIDRWIFGELGTFCGNPSRYVGLRFVINTYKMAKPLLRWIPQAQVSPMFLNEHSFSQSASAVFHVADVSHAQDVDGLTHRIVETYGRLDCAF
jgi:hypothetical protein